MVIRVLPSIALATICFLVVSNVQGQQVSFDTEVTFLQLHTTTGAPVNNATGYEPGQRYSLSYMNERDIGVRFTYWEWDQTGRVNAVPLGMEVNTFDGEMFTRLNLTDFTQLEMSAGLRYSDMNAFAGAQRNHMNGLGGLVGVRGTAKLWDNGEFYARGKGAVIMGDGGVPAIPNSFDVVRTQFECGIGYEHHFYLNNGWVISPRIGGEWNVFQGGNPIALIDPSDIALNGLVLGINITR